MIVIYFVREHSIRNELLGLRFYARRTDNLRIFENPFIVVFSCLV